MTQKILCLFLFAAGLSAAAEPVTLYIELGLGANAVDRWDGALEVSNGKLARLEERHFGKQDQLTAPSAWKAQTRREQIDGFAKVNYNEMSPAELPPTQFSPIGLYATIDAETSAQVRVRTEQGDFDFRVAQIGLEPSLFLDGRASVAWTPTAERLSDETFEDDEPAVALLSDGSLAVAWVAYRERGDRVLLRTQTNGSWSSPEEVTLQPGDLWRTSLAVDEDGGLWAFWSARDGTDWDLWGRRRVSGQWQPPVRVSDEGTNTFHRAAASQDGKVFVVWQSFRGPARQAQSDIYLRTFAAGSWSDEMKVSSSSKNDWEPTVAGGASGSAYIAWDTYDKGDYDIRFRAFESGALGAEQKVTENARFQAHASVAVDPQGRPWLAWDESGTNWGKDQGYLVTPPLAVPLHQERSLRVAMWDGSGWLEPKEALDPFYVYRLFPNFENPQIAFDGRGMLTMVFRHWTRQRAHGVGAYLMWENFLTRFDGDKWTTPTPLTHSAGSIEKRAALVRAQDGKVHAAWMTDDRPFRTMNPGNAEIYYAELGSSNAPPAYGADSFKPLTDPFAEAVPIHPLEEENVKAIREYVIDTGDKKFQIHRGDMHRHTDVSQDFKYDGSLLEVYRYALDAAAFDYIVPTDHQLGLDMEFTWWQDEKLADLFHVPGSFTPMFGYERSLTFPNGHRNVIFGKRGTRTLPIPDDERRGEARTGPNLFPYLRENDGISMPHSSGTAQGTDFFDNDPELEPLIEIFQGYRASYEYQGAPLAASVQKLREQRSGFNASGYYWEALAKGLKLGVQASSDHWSTHLSYAMIVSEDSSRESMFAALKKRHAYGATDNIILDFQAEAGGETYIMGDIVDSDEAPRLKIKAVGTDRIKQLVIIKNEAIIYVRQPNADSIELRFTDRDFEPGSNYYYVRVVQNNNMVAWSSPIWVE